MALRAATMVVCAAATLAACAGVTPQADPPDRTPTPVATADAGPALQQVPPLTAQPGDPAAFVKTVATLPAAGEGAQGDPAAPVRSPLLPPGWAPWTIHPSKKSTRYRLEMLDGRMALRADADSSASGLITRLSIDPNRQPVLSWRWRIDSLVSGADNTDRYAEDAPVRVVLAFDGDKRTLPFRDQLFFEQVKLLAGREMPYATLMYIWENRKPVGAVIRNPNTDRVRKIVVASGPAGVRKWLEFRRNIVEDYKLAFGKPPPGRLVGVAILTDTDNTRQKVTAWYGDITLTR